MQNNYGVDMGIPGIQERRIEPAFDVIDRWDLVLETFARRYNTPPEYWLLSVYACAWVCR